METATATPAHTSADHETYAVHEARALVRGVDECRCRTCQRIRNAEAAKAMPTWSIAGVVIGTATTCTVELDGGNCDMVLLDVGLVWHDGDVDSLWATSVEGWSCAAPTLVAMKAWLKANESAVKDAVFEAYAADGGWSAQ